MKQKASLKDVIDGGYCIGCGVCAVLDPAIRIEFDEHRKYVARIPPDPDWFLGQSAVCPFADGVPNESALEVSRVTGETSEGSLLGPYVATYAGWALEGGFRTAGSSGGLTTWVLARVVQEGIVDHVIHVVPRGEGKDGPLFSFGISSDVDSLTRAAKSRYYPVEMSKALKFVKDHPGRYALVGVPCFVKAARLLQDQDPVFRDRIRLVIGLVCGHLKSAAYADFFALESGVPPANVSTIDFRHKSPGSPANHYAVEITYRSKDDVLRAVKSVHGMFGANWGHGFFKYKACDFCDDVVGEMADLSVGDAWLPEYQDDHRGTNILVVRNHVLNRLLLSGRDARSIHLVGLSYADAVASQDAGFRHKREGLAYRLWLADQWGKWRPQKRVAASASHIGRRQRRIFASRMEIAERSHEAFRVAMASADPLRLFKQIMIPVVSRYEMARVGRVKALRKWVSRQVRSMKERLIRFLRAGLLSTR